MVNQAQPFRNVEAEKAAGRRFFFVYQTPNIATIAAAASSTNAIQFDQDSRFIWTKLTYFTDLAGAAITSGARIVPLVTLQMTDTGSGQSFFNAATPIPSLCGDSGSLPYILPAPQEIQPNTSFQFSYTNYSAATTYANLRIQLHGFKLYV